MSERIRDPYDIPITTDERWVSIPFDRYNTAAIEWAKAEFGNGFFNFGGKFFFSNETLLVQFKLRWV